MLLSPYGLRTWGSLTVAAVLLGSGAAWLAWWWVLPPLLLVWLAAMLFFRDPPRAVPVDLPAGSMLSPADGVVSAVLEVDDHPATGGPAAPVRIFLSVLDVHVNRAPCDGRVVAVNHVPGRFLDARTEESAVLNESNLITIDIEGGETIGVRQVAGKVARRIVCGLEPGDRVVQGHRFGMIKFGSTTELILPRPGDVHVHVERGRRVKAGLTILATLGPRSAQPARSQTPHAVAGESRAE